MPTRTLSYESLENRKLMTTASDIVWEPQPLSAENGAAVLPGSTAGAMKALDLVALDGSKIARGLQDGTVEIFDTATGALIHRIPGLGVYVSDIALSPDGRYITIGTDGVRIFDAQTFSEVGRFSTQGFVYPVAFIGNEIFSGTWEDKAITVYNTETRTVRTIAGGANQANFLTTLGDRLYAYDYRGTLKELHPQTGAVLRSVQTPGGIHLSSSPTSGIVAIGANTGNVAYFDANLQSLGATNPGIGPIEYIGFDASGTKLSARSPGTVAFLDLADVPSGGAAQEVGRVPTTGAGPFESSLPMTRDGSAVFIRTTAEGVIAQRTPWADAVDAAIEDVAEDVQHALELPEELETLITEAVASLDDETAWRSPETNEVSVRPLPKGMHLDLRSVQGLVSGVRTTVLGTGPVTAHVYRGSEEIETLTIGADGAFSVENDDGVTDVVFSGVGICAGTIELRTDEDAPPATGEALSPFTSKPYAIAAAPSVPIPTNVAYVAGTLNYSSSSGIGGQSRRYIMRDASLYTLIRTSVTQGSGTIWSVGTIKKDGTDHMGREYGSTSGFPEGYARWHGDNTVLIAPGAPVPISFVVGSTGSTGSIIVTHGTSPEALLPPSTMSRETVDATIITMNDQHQTEGVFPALTEVRESSSPTFAHPGDILNVQYHVRNEALAGGMLAVDVYVGWYGGEATRGTLQGSFALGIGGGETRRISANVTAPSKPADATSDRPIISAVVRLPDGTTVEHAKLGKEPKSETRVFVDGTMRIVSREYTLREQTRINELTGRALNELITSSDNRLTAARNALGIDRVIELIARNTAEALALAERVGEERAPQEAVIAMEEHLGQDVDDVLNDREGVGGSDSSLPADAEAMLAKAFKGATVPSEARTAATIVADGTLTPRQLYAQALEWEMPADHPLTMHLEGIQQTITGKILTIGIMRMYMERGNALAQWTTAFKLQLITDIPAPRLIVAANKSDATSVATAFKELLHIAQYGSLISSTAETGNPGITMAEPNKVIYDIDDTHIRIRFDLSGTTAGVRNVRVYDGTTLVGLGGPASYVSVPIANLPTYGGMSGGTNPVDLQQYNLRLEVRLSDNTELSRPISTVKMHPNLPEELRQANGMQVNVGEYSTLSIEDNPIRRGVENHALSSLAQNFILPNQASWTWHIASDYHNNSAFHAADILNGSFGAKISTPDSGKIVFNRLDSDENPTVVFEHTAEINGQAYFWYSKYLHQYYDQTTGLSGPRDENGTVVGLPVGIELPARMHFSNVASFGSSTAPHVHTEFFMKADGSQITNGNYFTGFESIDLRKSLTQEIEGKTMTVRATSYISGDKNGLQLTVTWRDEAWVNEQWNIALDRTELAPNVDGDNSYWIANHSDPFLRKKVVWILNKLTNGHAWVESDNYGNPIAENNQLRKWNGTAWELIDAQL